MKDSIFLLFSAIGFAGIAWSLWHFLSNDTYNVLLTLALLAVVIDNVRLRRQLRLK